ncbi:hypothetical protein K438DRAFT_1783291 [Mycena galopus ATCC 62051]|nr:hypothetical protein K438DRAFT_1783291 [Mycena galopus ATCC 62051]
MCDTVPTSILLGALSLLPDNRYISVALGLAGLILHIINGHRPSNKLGRLGGAIESVEGTLKRAKEDYPWIYAELMNVTNRLLEVKLLRSKIQTRTLEPCSVTSWKEFAAYIQNSWEIMRDILKCAKNVKEIQVSAMGIIEGERQWQFSAGIQESRDILEKVTCSLARLTSKRHRGYESATHASYDSIRVPIKRNEIKNARLVCNGLSSVNSQRDQVMGSSASLLRQGFATITPGTDSSVGK